MDKTKDIIKDLLGKISGVDLSIIKISKDKKKKKRKEKKNNNIKNEKTEVINENGIEINHKKYPDFIEFNDIRKGKNYKKNSLDEWTAINFVFFAKQLYYDIYHKDCELNTFPACKEINKLKDIFSDLYGCCSNRLMYDYILYFFENFIRKYVKENEQFYFSQLLSNAVIESFYNNYDFEKSLYKEIKINDQLSSENIEKSYILNEENLIYNYGIIIAINWLISKNIERNNAVRKVYIITKQMYKNKLFGHIIKVTEKWSPYPDWFMFKNINKFLKTIDNGLIINVKFENSDLLNNKFKSLKIGKDG